MVFPEITCFGQNGFFGDTFGYFLRQFFAFRLRCACIFIALLTGVRVTRVFFVATFHLHCTCLFLFGACPRVLPDWYLQSVLSVETNTKNVTSAISVLNSRLGLLEPAHLDHIEGRLAALLQKLNTISEKKAALDDAEKNNKIAELYEMVTANQAMATALPDVVDRLDSLQALHEQALQFSKTLVQLDSFQQKLETSLSGNQKVLEETQAKMAANLETVQTNFDTIEKRLSKLKK